MKRRAWLRIAIPLAVICSVVYWHWRPGPSRSPSTASFHAEAKRFAGLRFDPAYFYDRGQTARELAAELVARWHDAGLNAVLFRVYDPAHGANYRTGHPHSRETDYGRQDLLSWTLKEAHGRGMKVYAWLTPLNHAGAWEAKPEWRALRPSGEPYQASSLPYPLCARHPQVRKWWRGFVADLFDRHPDLDGLDLAEPALSWRETEACYCGLCSKEFRDQPPARWTEYRADPLTRLILDTFRQVRTRGKETMLTTVLPADAEGNPQSFAVVRDQTGLDLEAVLASPDRPRWLSVELMWQEWAGITGNRDVFRPSWAKGALEEVRRRVGARASVLGHLELTDFGDVRVRPEDLAAAIAAALEAGAEGFEVYDAALLEKKSSWWVLRRAAATHPRKRVLILHHLDRETGRDPSDPPAAVPANRRSRLNQSDAWQLATLCGHFCCEVEVRSLDGYAAGDAKKVDALFYLGVNDTTVPPRALLEDLADSRIPVLWLGANLEHLLAPGPERGLTWVGSRNDPSYDSVCYRGKALLRKEPTLNLLQVTDPAKVQVLAEVVSRSGPAVPYAVRSGQLWYFADDPLSYAVEGGAYAVLADVLHDVLGEDHAPKKLAMVRLEDVHPLTPPAALRAAARLLHARGVPFLISLVPIYKFPKEGDYATLGDRPEFAEAVREAVALGGVIVMHGVTHQLTGETAADYEFWDRGRNGATAGRTDAKTRARLLFGLEECRKHGIYPLLWETPHYASTLEDYRVFSTVFSAAVERRQSVNRIGSDQLCPYPIFRDRYGQLLLPENLGYVPLDDQRAAPILEAAERTAVVRDATVCFFFHLCCDLGVLKEIVGGLQDRGFAFPDVRSLPLSVAGPDFQWSSTRAPFPAQPPGSLAALLDAQGGEIWRGPSAEFPREKERELGMRLFLPREEEEVASTDSGDGLSAKPLQAGILAPPEEAAGIAAVFRALSAPVHVLALRDELAVLPPGLTLLVVSEDSGRSLGPAARLRIERFLGGGGTLLTWGKGPLAEELGIRFEEGERTVTRVWDRDYPDVPPLDLGRQAPVAPVVCEESDEVLAAGEDGVPLLTVSSRGRGKVLYSALPPFGAGGAGPFTYLLSKLKDHGLVAPACRSKALEVYFDYGERQNQISKEELVELWSNHGVRVIHAAAWHDYSNWTYEYDELLELAHQNSMLVYAWLSLPGVSEKLWEAHPEWREKNPLGGEVKGRRKAVSLVDPACREAVKKWIADLLGRYPFDGVNLAGLSFSGETLEKPETLAPFSEPARHEFHERHGFDPRELFSEESPRFWKRSQQDLQTLLAWRKHWTTSLHAEFLEYLSKLPGAEQRALVVSVLDAAANPAAADLAGVDQQAVLALRKTFPFQVQIMDAGNARPWGAGRLQGVLQDYSGLVDPADLAFQVDITQAVGLGNRALTGIPLYLLLEGAGGRPLAIYSEESIVDADWPFLAPSLAGATAMPTGSGELSITSRSGVRFPLASDRRLVRIGGKLWPAVGSGEVLVPPGEQRLEMTGQAEDGARILDASCPILEAEVVSRGIRFAYQSRDQAWFLLSREAVEVEIDGRAAARTLPRAEGRHGWPLRCPPGRHDVVAITESLPQFAVRVGGLALSGGIVVFSGAALGVIALLFLWARRSHRRGPARPALMPERRA